MRLILASQSPRRSQLLLMLGLNFETMPADIDETYLPGEEPGAHAERLAREKAEAIANRFPDATIVGSDTVVIVDGTVLGKPRDDDEAVRMLLRLQGREHIVATGIAVWHNGKVHSDVERVGVRFGEFDEQIAQEYVATREPMDKAGAYGIQGYGAVLIEAIHGDFFAVMGLPIYRMSLLLQAAGLHYNFQDLQSGEPSGRYAQPARGDGDVPVTVRWSADGRAVELLDQTRLPEAEVYLRLTTAAHVARAIHDMRVRGAPAIGVAAALGLGLEASRHAKQPRDEFMRAFDAAYHELRAARPTAVNLTWAVDRLRRKLDSLGAEQDLGVIACKLYGEASAVLEEDRAMSRSLAEHAQSLLPQHGPIRALTVCNAGKLATAGLGTALAPLYLAHERGRKLRVYACETRPLLQGSRLTAWELQQAGISCTIVVDSAAPLLLRDHAVDVVLVGADRIAANGDIANKVGTYSLALHAERTGVPFIVLAPSSTIDPLTTSGHDIPIEYRAADEVRRGFGALTAPANVDVFAPAFDVTPAELITAIVTDKGVFRPPYDFAIAATEAAR